MMLLFYFLLINSVSPFLAIHNNRVHYSRTSSMPLSSWRAINLEPSTEGASDTSSIGSSKTPQSIDIDHPSSSSYFDPSPWTNYDESLQLYHQLMSCEDEFISHHIKSSLETLQHAYRLYGPASVVGSYNGGKDACVIMHLCRAAHAKWYHDILENNKEEKVFVTKPRVVYFENPSEFPEIVDLLEDTVEKVRTNRSHYFGILLFVLLPCSSFHRARPPPRLRSYDPPPLIVRPQHG